MIIGMILLILLFFAPFIFLGTGSPFGGVFANLAGGDLRQRLFGDTGVKLDELDTNCDILSDDTFDVSDDCSIDIEGSDETVNFDTPRDLILKMCWGSVIINMSNSAEKIEVEDALIPTERNAESLTINVFKEGDTEVDIECESNDCRIAINDTECPAQRQIARQNIETSGCSINDDNQIIFRQNCILTIDTTDSEDEDGNDNPIFFDADSIPRVLELDYCQGEMLFSANSEEENFTFYEPLEIPDDTRHREVDIYGEDRTSMSLICIRPPEATPTPDDFRGTSSESPACMVVISNADCFP